MAYAQGWSIQAVCDMLYLDDYERVLELVSSKFRSSVVESLNVRSVAKEGGIVWWLDDDFLLDSDPADTAERCRILGDTPANDGGGALSDAAYIRTRCGASAG